MRRFIIRFISCIIFLMYLVALNCSLVVYAETTTETFLNSFVTDLPEAVIGPCRTGGPLQEIVSKTQKFKSAGNSLFVDQNSHKIAVFERAKDIDSNENKENSVELYIQVDNVSQEQIEKLLLPPRELVFIEDAMAKYFIKVKDGEEIDLYEFDGLDNSGNEVNVSVKTIVKRLDTIKNNGQEFIVIDGKIKINFPIPPKKVLPDGSTIDVFEESPSVIECKFKHIPVADIDLSEIETAYNEGLADAIIEEATEN